MLNRIRTWWENLDENYKRIALGAGFTVIIVLLAYLIYYVFFKPELPAPGEIITPPEGVLPGADIRKILEREGIALEEERPTLPPEELKPDIIAQGGKTLATPEVYTNANSPSINNNGNINFYNPETEKFYTLLPDGGLRELSSQTFPNVETVTWAPQENKGVLEFPDGSNIFYDFDKDQQYTLPKEAEGFNFSPSGGQLGYRFIGDRPENNWLVVSKPTGEQMFAVQHIGEANPQDVIVNWSPDTSKVGYFRSSASLNSEEIIFLGKNNENFKSLEVAGKGFVGLWSPEGNILLYNVYSAETSYRPELWLTNAQDKNLGNESKNLNLRTWVEKCVFASDNSTIYCGIPLYIIEGGGIYPTLSDTVPDVIYKINAKTGFKQQIAIPTNSLGISVYTVNKLFLSPDDKILYLADKIGGIYKIQLEE